MRQKVRLVWGLLAPTPLGSAVRSTPADAPYGHVGKRTHAESKEDPLFHRGQPPQCAYVSFSVAERALTANSWRLSANG